MTLERINPADLPVPRGYSHATIASGRVVFIAGQTALDSTGVLVPGTVVEQFERALMNLLTALAAAGATPADLANMTIYTTDIDDYRAHATELGALWRTLMGGEYPAIAVIGVHRLWDAEAVVELQAVASLP